MMEEEKKNWSSHIYEGGRREWIALIQINYIHLQKRKGKNNTNKRKTPSVVTLILGKTFLYVHSQFSDIKK